MPTIPVTESRAPLPTDVSAATAFDPLDFAIVSPRTFERRQVGEIFRAASRTVTDAHASAFEAVSASR
jgi:hypothetical protein